MDRKLCFYDTKDVIKGELEAYIAKNGKSKLAEEIEAYIDSELELLKLDLEDLEDFEKVKERFENSIEDEDGNVWITIKVFNINRFQKMFGTEPD